ncbi:hypothetical protein [Mycoplasma sp. CSL7503-lung]|uniref:hypothetical protein n=1 Tax=Mycoplasma sp. CSL7503-lung TaxID=536372 RepID=UPI0021D1389D|nr:hypothetical protein [Mycoplasma sp. CSL7503-lung]MCU4706909.1 hypothetical protein [Mycoplasma sp. CSL7503-lung]
MKKRYKFLLGSTVFATVALTTTSIIMIPRQNKNLERNGRYIITNKNNFNKLSIDYATLLIDKLADKLTEAQNFIKNNNILKDDSKIVKLRNKIEASGENLKDIIKDNSLILNELEEINNLLNEAKQVPGAVDNNGSYYENINIKNLNNLDKIINVPVEEAKNNVREELEKAIEEIENVKMNLNDKALDDISKKANEYISIAKETLDEEDNVNKLQAYLTITLDKKAEVLFFARKIEKRKEEIKNNLLKIQESLRIFNNLFTGNNIDLIDGISKYLAFNFAEYKVYDQKNKYIFDFLDFYYKNKKPSIEIVLPKNLVTAKRKMIEFLSEISNDQHFINNINSVQLEDLENLNKIIENWLFPNYTVDRFADYNNAILKRFEKNDDRTRDNLGDNYDKYLYTPGGGRPRRLDGQDDEKIDIKNLTKDTKNSDWMWLDNIKNEKLYSKNEIIKNDKYLDNTFKFDVILSEIHKFSIEILNKQLDKLNIFINEKTPNDEITLLDFAEIIYSDEFIEELYISFKNDGQEIITNNSIGSSDEKELSTYDKFKEYYKSMLESFKKFASNENKNINISIKDIKDLFIKKINLYKKKIELNEIHLNELNSISSGDFRDLFVSSIMWKFNQKLVDINENQNIADTIKDEGYNEDRFPTSNYNNSNDKRKEYKYKTYKNWLDSKSEEYKNNVITLLSDFKTNINDTIFEDNALIRDLTLFKYSRGDEEDSNTKRSVNISDGVFENVPKKIILNYHENGIDENFRNNIQNGFDSFIYNLSNQNNNKEILLNLYSYIENTFESKKDFFSNENNKVETDLNQRKYLKDDNGKNQEKLDFLEFHIKKRFKKLVDLINNKNIKFATISKTNQFSSQNKDLSKLNYLLNKNDFNWTNPLWIQGNPSRSGFESHNMNHFVNYKNFINWKYNNILVNYELLYTLTKIADYIKSSNFDENKLAEIWSTFKVNFDFNKNDYEVDYFITQNDFTINDELRELLNSI